MKPLRGLNWAGSIYFGGTAVAGLAIIPISLAAHPLTSSQAWPLAYLALATQIAALAPIPSRRGVHAVFSASLIAAALFAPGAGVALIAWLATFDGRLPSKQVPLYRLLFARANLALAYGLPSLLLSSVPSSLPDVAALPTRTLVYAVFAFVVNYGLTAQAFAFMHRTSMWAELRSHTSLVHIQSMLLLAVAGGALYLLLQSPVGYIMGTGILAFVVLARAAMIVANEQAEARLQTLRLLAEALDARDRYTESHSERVAGLAVALARLLQLSDRDVDRIQTAGSLHDLGKIGIPDAVLNKDGPLTTDEWELMKSHAARGASMISQHSFLAPLAPLVRGHHERWDGGGYPDSLSGDSIPLGARILAVADSFDTITGPRVYRRSVLTALEALADIEARAGTWYDPAVVEALRLHIHGEPANSAEGQRASTVAFLRANPKFGRFLVGSTISALGDPLTTVGSLLILYTATHSPWLVAVAYVARSVGNMTAGALAGLVDRFARQRLIVSLEIVRGLALFAAPLIVIVSPYALLPLLFATGIVNSIVQPARQAATPTLIAQIAHLHRANALLATGTAVGLAGYGVAAVFLSIWNAPSMLLVIDGATFLLAGVSVIGLGNLGGGGPVRWWDGLRRGFTIPGARPHLAIAAAASLAVGITMPSLINLAYGLAPGAGALAYTLLEGALGGAVVLASLVIVRARLLKPRSAYVFGLAGMGIGSLALAISPTFAAAVVILFLASLGNPVYVVGNQTALQTIGDDSVRGSILGTRFFLTQLGTTVGAAVAGYVLSTSGPRIAYGIAGLGLVTLAVVARNIGRRSLFGEARQLPDGQMAGSGSTKPA